MRLGAIYGHRWSSQFPTDATLSAAKREWAIALADRTTGDLEHGLARAKIEHPSWPPTLGEFAALCRPPATAPEHRDAGETLRALPKPAPSYDAVRPYLQAVRSRLRGDHHD